MDIALPHTIEIIAREKLAFLGTVIKDGAECLEFVHEIQPTWGPAMHVHYQQDESITVVSGVMGYQEFGGQPKHAVPGETLLFKAGTPHRFWNAGLDMLYCKGYNSPANNVVYFLSAFARSINEHGGKPGIYDAAFLLKRYKSEFGMLEIPAFVQKVIFPVILFWGNLTGKSKKFADAPPPI
ncbi:MAG TPA: cupin domain-containing protein [Chitinophagaceae bacterium]